MCEFSQILCHYDVVSRVLYVVYICICISFCCVTRGRGIIVFFLKSLKLCKTCIVLIGLVFSRFRLFQPCGIILFWLSVTYCIVRACVRVCVCVCACFAGVIRLSV
jgi:hypothetical protein